MYGKNFYYWIFPRVRFQHAGWFFVKKRKCLDMIIKSVQWGIFMDCKRGNINFMTWPSFFSYISYLFLEMWAWKDPFWQVESVWLRLFVKYLKMFFVCQWFKNIFLILMQCQDNNKIVRFKWWICGNVSQSDYWGA